MRASFLVSLSSSFSLPAIRFLMNRKVGMYRWGTPEYETADAEYRADCLHFCATPLSNDVAVEVSLCSYALTKKLARIRKAEAAGWDRDNP